MRANPLLARNVVMLAMRHAIADSLGGTDKAEDILYRQTYYHLALTDFTGAQACDGSTLARGKLAELFPNWRFEYWVTDEQKEKEPSLKNCPKAFEVDPSSQAPLPERGAGVGVSVAEFYVLIPSPSVLSTGVFEQPDSLRLALIYRDRVSQNMIDRTIANTVKSLSGDGNKAKTVAATTAFVLLNEGWGWQHRKKSE
jgi:hypothetical protein